jgi:dCMP deaminase
MATQSSLDEAYLDIAKRWAQLSTAKRKKVGCIIVKRGAIISDGYNGTPSGFDNNCETHKPIKDHKMVVDEEGKLVEGTYELITKPEVLHAESNAITKLAKSTQTSVGSTMYITISPCVECSKLIIQAGIERVVFREFYRSQEAINFLKKANIKVEQRCTLNSKN